MISEPVNHTLGRVLDVGCGNNKVPGAIGADLRSDTQADVICNLNYSPYPFADGSFDAIVSNHSLEHFSDVQACLREFHRVSKHNAVITVNTPHCGSVTSFADLTHQHHCAFDSMNLILNHLSYITGQEVQFEIIVRRIILRKPFRWLGLEVAANRFPRIYENYFVHFFTPALMHYRLRVLKTHLEKQQ